MCHEFTVRYNGSERLKPVSATAKMKSLVSAIFMVMGSTMKMLSDEAVGKLTPFVHGTSFNDNQTPFFMQ